MYDIPKNLSNDLLPLLSLVNFNLSPEVIISGQPMLLHTDVLETPDHLLIRLNLPGARPEHISVTLAKNILTIAAKLESSPETFGYLWRERPSGEVFRSIALIGDLEMCSGHAFLEFGVLTVQINKAKSHAILVQTNALVENFLTAQLNDTIHSQWY